MARKILLADDSVTAQNMGRKILADAGYEVITVNNGSAALKKISEAKPDVIVLDVYMPGYSGLEVCQRLKETGETSRIPILLTVGKLEPFKPEEAKRARADAFIVKPFEASELLSALTKLEDKIVPRAESSKPGRFARTIAIVEEGRYDSTMAAQEDSSWKNRIAFPSRKKKNAEAENVDDPAIYNPVNKDLRTVIERKPPETAQESTQQGSTVDVAALAEHGLPKDVTPEEIAALAAAAAQIKGTIGDQPADSEPAREQKKEEVAAAAQPEVQAQEKIQEKIEEKIEARAEEKKIEEAKPEAVKAEEVKTENARNEEAQKEEAQKEENFEVAATRASDGPTIAVAKAFEVLQRFAEKPFSSVSEPVPANLPSLAAHNIAATPEGSSIASHAEVASEEPVTMAVAAGAEHTPIAPRWAAVSVALLPEESAISLEQEMQKASAQVTPVPTPSQETLSVVAPTDSPTSFSISATESISASTPAPAIGDTAAPELEVRPAEATSLPATDFSAPQSWQPEAAPSPAHIPQFPIGEVRPAEASVAEAIANESVAKPDARSEESALAQSAPEPAAISQSVAVAEIFRPASEQDRSSQVQQSEGPRSEEIRSEEVRSEAIRSEGRQIEDRPTEDRQIQDYRSDEIRAEAPAQQPEPQSDRSTAELAHESSSTHESITPAVLPEVAPAAEAIAAASGTADAEPQARPVAASAEPATTEAAPVQKESEIAATTAAAWASWRRIRESGDSKISTPPASGDDKADSDPQNTAAMAAAAGAERPPEEAAAPSNTDLADSDSGDIANIVDSVLADLRPKIVAEISKKMGKKK